MSDNAVFMYTKQFKINLFFIIVQKAPIIRLPKSNKKKKENLRLIVFSSVRIQNNTRETCLLRQSLSIHLFGFWFLYRIFFLFIYLFNYQLKVIQPMTHWLKIHWSFPMSFCVTYIIVYILGIEVENNI